MVTHLLELFNEDKLASCIPESQAFAANCAGLDEDVCLNFECASPCLGATVDLHMSIQNQADCEANGACSSTVNVNYLGAPTREEACTGVMRCVDTNSPDVPSLYMDEGSCTLSGNTWQSANYVWTPAVWTAGPIDDMAACSAAGGDWRSWESGHQCCDGSSLRECDDCCDQCLNETNAVFPVACSTTGPDAEGWAALCGAHTKSTKS
jgi:hypothetical protein